MTRTRSSLLPLPLTPFEVFLLAEDREEYPACPVVIAELSGSMDEEAFREAVRQAVRRHPLFHATVRRDGFRRPHWIESDQEPVVTFHQASEAPADGQSKAPAPDEFPRIDLTSEPGLRLRVRLEPDRAVVSCQVHHCCADGPGIHRFLGDVLAIYGQMTAYDDPPELLPLDPMALIERDQWPSHLRRQLRSPRFWVEFAYSLYQYVTRVPSPLIRADGASGVPTVGAHTTYLERDQVRRLRRILQERGVTINDILASEVLRYVQEWNESRGGSPRQLLRLVVPTDLRSGDRGALPAANCLHVAFFGFRIREIKSMGDLAAACRAKMRELFDSTSSTHFDLGLSIVSSIPGLLERMARSSKRKGTAILSSLGDPTRFYAARLPRRDGRPVAGSLTLERLAVRSLVRPGTYLNISTSTLADRLAISATVDEGHLGAGSASRIADEFRQRLLALLDAEVTPTAGSAKART